MTVFTTIGTAMTIIAGTGARTVPTANGYESSIVDTCRLTGSAKNGGNSTGSGGTSIPMMYGNTR